MKKLIVLLLAFVLAGAAFAQTPTVSGSATLSWGVDLDSGYTGFKNAYTAKVTVPFAVANQKKAGDKGWWGEIELKNIVFKLTDDPIAPNSALGFVDWTDLDGDGVYDPADDEAPASIAAKITNGVWAITVYNRSSLAFDKAAEISGEGNDVAPAFLANTFGSKLSYAGTGYSAALIVNSKGDWTTNASNDYAVGATASYTLNDNFAVNGGFGWDVLDSTNVNAFAFYVGAPMTFGALSVTPTADIAVLPVFNADALVDVAYNLTEDAAAYAGLQAYFSTVDNDLEFTASVTEELAGGFVNNVEAGAYVNLYNPLTALAWEVGANAGYKYLLDATSNVYAEVAWSTMDTFGTTNKADGSITYTNTAIANTTITLKWNNPTFVFDGATAPVFGTLVAAAKVSL